MKRFCRYCGNELNDDASFCRKCGKKVSVESIGTQNTEKMRPPEAEETKFSRKCGKLISSTADFCKYCGCQMSASGAQASDHLKENTFSGNRVVPLSGNVVNTGYNGNPNVYRQMPRKKSPKPVIAIVLVVAILFVTLVKPGYLRTYLFSGNSGDQTYSKINKGNTGSDQVNSEKNKTDKDSDKGSGIDTSARSLLLSSTDENWLEERGDIILTQENSPGAVAFIPIRYSKSEIEKTTPVTVTVNQDSTHAEVNTQRGPITVDFWDWNLTEEDDTLIVRELPVRKDDETGTEIAAYDFSMSSGTHEFMTSNHIRIPRTASADQECSVVWFDEENGRWEPAPFEYNDDGTCYDVYLHHFTVVGERKDDENLYFASAKRGDTPFIEIGNAKVFDSKSSDSGNEIKPVKVTASSVKGYFCATQDLRHYILDGVGQTGNAGLVADLYGLDSTVSGLSKLAGNPNIWTPAKALQTKLGWSDPAMNKLGLGIVVCKIFSQYFNGGSFYQAIKDNGVDLSVGATSIALDKLAEATPAITKWLGRKLVVRWFYNIGSTIFHRELNYAVTLGMKALIGIPVLAKAITIMCVLVGTYQTIIWLTDPLPGTELDPNMAAYQLYLKEAPVTVNGYSGLTIRNTKDLMKYFSISSGNQKPLIPKK